MSGGHIQSKYPAICSELLCYMLFCWNKNAATFKNNINFLDQYLKYWFLNCRRGYIYPSPPRRFCWLPNPVLLGVL
jgi:hypothetical protein